jgi:hypothetical protein
MTRATSDVASVPYIGISAPKRSIGGFHSAVHRKLKPNLSIAGMAPCTSEMMMPARSSSVTRAKNRVRLKNTKSPMRWRSAEGVS